MKKVLCYLLCGLILLQLFVFPTEVSAETIIQWGNAQKGTYSNLHPFTFLWSGDVFSDLMEGLNLKTMKTSTDKDKIDIVINQYGSIASHGIREVSESLEENTDLDNYQTFSSTVRFSAGKVYLLATCDNSYAKIRIDQVLPGKVTFSYVLPSSIGEVSKSQTGNQIPTSNGASSQTSGTALTPNTSSSPSLLIQLQISSNEANINGTTKKLDVAPMTLNDYIMVPLRFISEAFGATVKWYETERKALITYGSSNISLWVGNSAVQINGQKVEIGFPAQNINGCIMVPTTFISKAFDKDVIYAADTKTIQIKDKVVTPPATKTQEAGITFLYGKWSLWNPGGIMYTTDGVSTYQNIVSGVGGQTLEIRPDGTYTWKLYDEVVEGNWKRDGDTILLPKGDYGWEWHVGEYQFDDVKGIKVYRMGTWRDGKRIE